jgi:hypothetical protein
MLTSWVHDLRETPDIVFNRGAWNAGAGSVIRVTPVSGETELLNEEKSFMFIVPEDEPQSQMKYGLQVCPPVLTHDTYVDDWILQISLPQALADSLHIRNGDSLQLTKVHLSLLPGSTQLNHSSQVDRKRFVADYVELVFQDQYLGRNDMWRLVEKLEGKGKNTCLYVGQELSFLGSVAARVTAIHMDGKKVRLFHTFTRSRMAEHSLGLCWIVRVHHEGDIPISLSQDHHIHSGVP